MEARFKVELRERDPAKIDQLYLDNCKCVKIEGLSDDMVTLDTLSMVNCGLESLEGLPSFPELVIFDISQNKLTGGLEILGEKCPKLEKLVLSDNKFATLEQLEPLKALTALSVLDTFQNDVEDTDDYRTKIFEMFPSLKDLNGHDINGEVTEELEEEEETGAEAEDSDGGADTSDEEDGPGLEYLQNSNIMDDEDETEDFEAVEGDDVEEGGDGGASTRRGLKRRHEGGDDEESNQ